MPHYEIVPATFEHGEALAEKMRQADVDEVWAACRRRPREAVLSSMVASRDPKTGLADGEIACIFGIATPHFMSERYVPWMLSTDVLPKHARRFLRESRGYVERCRAEYPVLKNFVDARNVQAIKWLRWLGFDVQPPIPFGLDRIPFHPFEMRGISCAASQKQD